jgi:DNA-binding NarL/FixJ family response regulator
VRLFVVDDSPTARGMLRRVLAELSDVVLVGEATSGEECLTKVGALTPDIIVMDWRMPGINGAHATALLLARHPDLHVIGFTSYEEAGIRRAFLDAGAAQVFGKEDALRLRDYLRELTGSAERPG